MGLCLPSPCSLFCVFFRKRSLYQSIKPNFYIFCLQMRWCKKKYINFTCAGHCTKMWAMSISLLKSGGSKRIWNLRQRLGPVKRRTRSKTETEDLQCSCCGVLHFQDGTLFAFVVGCGCEGHEHNGGWAAMSDLRRNPQGINPFWSQKPSDLLRDGRLKQKQESWGRFWALWKVENGEGFFRWVFRDPIFRIFFIQNLGESLESSLPWKSKPPFFSPVGFRITIIFCRGENHHPKGVSPFF